MSLDQLFCFEGYFGLGVRTSTLGFWTANFGPLHFIISLIREIGCNLQGPPITSDEYILIYLVYFQSQLVSQIHLCNKHVSSYFYYKFQIKLFSFFFSHLFFIFLHLFNSVILFSFSILDDLPLVMTMKAKQLINPRIQFKR